MIFLVLNCSMTNALGFVKVSVLCLNGACFVILVSYGDECQPEGFAGAQTKIEYYVD